MAKKQVTKRKSKKPTKRVPGLPEDQAKAADIRARMVLALRPVAELMDEATAAGLQVSFGINPNTPDAKNHVSYVQITRIL